MDDDKKGLNALGNDYVRVRSTVEGLGAWFTVFLAVVVVLQVIGLVERGEIPLPKIDFWALVREFAILFVITFIVLTVIMAYTGP